MAKKRRRSKELDYLKALTDMTGMALTAGVGVYTITNVFGLLDD